MKVKSKKTRGHIRPESVMFDAQTRVDAEKGIVHNAKILGLKSRHGYTYSSGAAKAAIPLYEGAPVNIDHPDRKTPGASRSYRDRFGYFRNVRFVEGDGLRGQFRFNPKHAIAPQFIWDAQNNPKACGFSHNAKGPLTQKGNGELVCESIEAVRSVDLVADAATTASLFEGKPRMKVRNKNSNKGKTRRRQLSPEGRNRVRRQMIQRFGREVARELMESMGAEGAAAMMAGGGEGGGGGAGAVDALMSLIRSVIENPNISAEDSIKQVSKRLKALKDMIPGGSAAKPADDPAAALAEGDDDDDDADDDDRIESDDDDADDEPAPRRRKNATANSRLEAALDRLEAREEREAIAELCEGMGFKPTKAQLGLLAKVADDEDREALIESWQESNPAAFRFNANGGNKPKSRELQEGQRGGGYKSAKEWAAGLKR